MATSIRTLVNNEIRWLQKEIARRRSELAALREELIMLKKIYRLLGGGAAPRRSTPLGRARKATAGNVDWNLVLKRLPATFTAGAMARRKAAKGKSQVYLRQIISRWVKQGKTERIARGRYRKK